ncbi:FAD/FMN-containing dehydrogenase [Cohaesibacter marisflavi]|uniref:FAD/FMN-containing dehydrogenase n=1 Tax=Cohaesibacter marisflavi TaxID=655353 RepID=A0A1I4ZW79_9HYPH|nr:FAD-binding and (Fe-S)-binding domain-containing protein [Cohaesibacter marisflavi]SFN54486.1 FAD/FMN-containing dehydrogenase [Cohaesibacter marisflavi]
MTLQIPDPEYFKALPSLLDRLAHSIKGTVRSDEASRTIFASDASAYQEMPLGVVTPEDKEDLITIVRFCQEHKVPLIPRGAGTSLAGQVVGSGLVLDMRRFNRILDFNKEAKWVTVEPSVIRNSLNDWLAPHGLLFGPETSTANRAVIGGMIGNNSCGMHSIVWGSTRDHLLACRAILADGSEASFQALAPEEFHAKRAEQTLEGSLYEMLYQELKSEQTRSDLEKGYPKASIRRRNNGYALDLLARSNIFTDGGPDFNMCKLIAGSEGTLCVLTEATLNLVEPLPPVIGVVAMHFEDSIESLKATLVALKYKPTSCELIGAFHVQQAMENNKINKFNTIARCSQWIIGAPESIIVVELADDSREAVERRAAALTAELAEKKMGYAWPLFFGEDVEKIWQLRRDLGGINSSKAGDIKPFEAIEDCAVDVEDQPAYVTELERILHREGVQFTHSAHAGDGELHTILFVNHKTQEGIASVRSVLEQVAKLVKRFRGSLSGEHGDGRLRAEFLPELLGDANYQLCKRVKSTFDASHIFNPNKIVDAPPMDVSLRYIPGEETPDLPTYFNWDKDQGLMRAVERCSGIGECKKVTSGLMCPSYMGTREEKDSTRARANILRGFLSRTDKANRYDHKEIKDILDLCLSCKGCKSECPAGVDMARMKAEFLQHYYDLHGSGLRPWLVAHFTTLMGLALPFAPLYNLFMGNRVLSAPVKLAAGFALDRSMPALCRLSFEKQYNREMPTTAKAMRKVHLFCDEFTNVNDAHIGMATVHLLTRLGYEVVLLRNKESGRSSLSQGFVKRAKLFADSNVAAFGDIVSEDAPMIAVEPSTIACFKDEYPDLVAPDLRVKAKALSKNSLMFEEFIAREMDAGHIGPEHFTQEAKEVRVHVHCHQKSISSSDLVVKVLSLPENYHVSEIPSSCCGMAGAFGYEKEHHALSMTIAEQILLPAVREADESVIIAASGTSCRHQIKDGAKREALHSAEILLQALKI